jgi:RNA polymerase sigma-70 factor (ECF subfamily)
MREKDSASQAPVPQPAMDTDLLRSSGFLYRFVSDRMPKSLQRFLGVSDIVQSVVFRIVNNRTQFLGSAEEQYRGWVLRIARNRMIDGIRKFRSSAEVGELQGSSLIDLAASCPSETLSEEEQAELLIQAIDDLPLDYQQILLLRYRRGMTFPAIADELKIPVTTCRRKWLEACELLRVRLRPMILT